MKLDKNFYDHGGLFKRLPKTPVQLLEREVIKISDENYFFATAPGSTEMYLIPTCMVKQFIEWCQCEFFDESWIAWADFFMKNEIIFKHA